jgi:hypothetical protein
MIARATLRKNINRFLWISVEFFSHACALGWNVVCYEVCCTGDLVHQLVGTIVDKFVYNTIPSNSCVNLSLREILFTLYLGWGHIDVGV